MVRESLGVKKRWDFCSRSFRQRGMSIACLLEGAVGKDRPSLKHNARKHSRTHAFPHHCMVSAKGGARSQQELPGFIDEWLSNTQLSDTLFLQSARATVFILLFFVLSRQWSYQHHRKGKGRGGAKVGGMGGHRVLLLQRLSWRGDFTVCTGMQERNAGGFVDTC